MHIYTCKESSLPSASRGEPLSGLLQAALHFEPGSPAQGVYALLVLNPSGTAELDKVILGCSFPLDMTHSVRQACGWCQTFYNKTRVGAFAYLQFYHPSS